MNVKMYFSFFMLNINEITPVSYFESVTHEKRTSEIKYNVKTKQKLERQQKRHWPHVFIGNMIMSHEEPTVHEGKRC